LSKCEGLGHGIHALWGVEARGQKKNRQVLTGHEAGSKPWSGLGGGEKVPLQGINHKMGTLGGLTSSRKKEKGTLFMAMRYKPA